MKKLIFLFIAIHGIISAQIKEDEINKDTYKHFKNNNINTVTFNDGRVLNIGDTLNLKSSEFSLKKLVVIKNFKLTSKSSNILLSATVFPGTFPAKEDVIHNLFNSIKDNTVIIREKNLKNKYRTANIAIVDRSKKDSIISILRSYNTPMMNALADNINNIENLEKDSKIIGVTYLEYDDKYTFTAESGEDFEMGYNLSDLNKGKLKRIVRYKNGINEDCNVNLTIDASNNLKEIDYKVLKNISEYVLVDAKYSLKNKSSFIPTNLSMWLDANKRWNVTINYSGQNDYGAQKDGDKIYQFDKYGFLLSRF